ncbi:Crp/Fnr family transcriptional regulator [Chitinophaga lutea]
MEQSRHDFELLFETFERLGQQLPEAVAQEIVASTHIFEFEKDETILQYKEVCEHVYFIVKGLAMIKFDLLGKERIRWFLHEFDVFISVESFFRQLPSEHAIVALEPTRCIALPKDTLDDIGARHPPFYEVRRKLTEHYYIDAEKRNDYIHMTAMERCAHLFHTRPVVFERVNDYHLAQYLGMDSSTFSKVKKNMLKNLPN